MGKTICDGCGKWVEREEVLTTTETVRLRIMDKIVRVVVAKDWCGECRTKGKGVEK